MPGQSNLQIDEHRAAVLTGLSTTQLRRLAQEAALGQVDHNELFFTYDELRRICLLAAPSAR
jgi:hypothetical protein